MTNESEYKLRSPALVLIRFSFRPFSPSLLLLSRCLSFTGSERTGKRSLGPPLSRLFHSRGLSPFILLRDNTSRSRITKNTLSGFAGQLQLSAMTSATYDAPSRISGSQILRPEYFLKSWRELFSQVRKIVYVIISCFFLFARKLVSFRASILGR